MRRAACFAALVLVAACGGKQAKPEPGIDSVTLTERQTRLERVLADPDSGTDGRPLARWNLPARLQEISGLALTADGRLFTHGDERGKIFEVDYRRGLVVKEFTVGSPPVHGDFESITMVGDTIVLLTSDGKLYRFREGADSAVVEYTTQDTGLGGECEFEGMAFEPASHSLLMACKRVHDKAMKDSLVIFRWPLSIDKDGRRSKVSHLAIPMATVVGANGWDDFHPSDLTIDPQNGNYLLVASREKGIAEITPAGKLVFSRPLPSGHDQAEGIAVTKDRILLISDEAKGGPATITLYRRPR